MSLKTENAHQIGKEQNRLVSMAKLRRALQKVIDTVSTNDSVSKDQCNSTSSIDRAMILVVACACLAERGVLPRDLVGTRLFAVAKGYAEALTSPDLQVDGTEFASKTLASLFHEPDSADFLIRGKESALIKVLLEFRSNANLRSPLAAGWFKQCSIKETPKSVKVEDGHIQRSELKDIAQLTQWFTPDWIADFLVGQSVENKSDAKLIDPACGAGHLLVPALQRLFRLSPKKNATESLREILSNQLYGIDIDGELVALAKFAIYLTALDLNTAELYDLPVPQIYVLTDPLGVGSLPLGSRSLASELCTRLSIPLKFDAVVMNPPYLGHRTMPQPIRDFLRVEYPDSQYDLFAAFLELGLRITNPGCRLSAICQQSVLTIQRYGQLRKKLIKESNVLSVVQLGSGSFATKSGEKANNAILTIRKLNSDDNVAAHNKNSQPGEDDVHCWQILSRAEKTLAESKGLLNISHKIISRNKANYVATKLPDSPFSYWTPADVIKLFEKYPSFDDTATGITCTNGLFTCNNEKFVKHFTDIPADAQHEYVVYDKGGGHKWFRSSDLMLHWKQNGDEIRQYRVKRGQSAKLPGEAYYFKTGVTYSYIGTRGFKARLLSPNSVFDIASSAVFSEKIDILYILGLLNSSLTRCILGTLNPTINFQIGDIRRIPFKAPSTDLQQAVVSLVEEAVRIAAEAETFDSSSPRYVERKIPEGAMAKRLNHWVSRERTIQRRLDDIIFDMYEIGAQSRTDILADPYVKRETSLFKM